MREIKFRAWDRAINKMAEHGFIYFSGQVYSDPDDPCIRTPRDKDELILMQYTGLKDKNGKEIYEGDILHYSSEDKTVDYKFEVAWVEQNGCGCCGGPTNGYDTDHLDNAQIIGNVHENSDLLLEQAKA